MTTITRFWLRIIQIVYPVEFENIQLNLLLMPTIAQINTTTTVYVLLGICLRKSCSKYSTHNVIISLCQVIIVEKQKLLEKAGKSNSEIN